MRRRLQDKVDNRREQMLIDNHRHHREENGQQSGERQRFGKGFTDRVLVGDTRKGGGEDNHRQPNQPHFRQMQRQRQHQPNADNPLNDKPHGFLLRALLAAALVVVVEDFSHRIGQFGAVAEGFAFLQQETGENAAEKYRNGHRRHA